MHRSHAIKAGAFDGHPRQAYVGNSIHWVCMWIFRDAGCPLHPQTAGLPRDHCTAEPRLLMGIIRTSLSAQNGDCKFDQVAQAA